MCAVLFEYHLRAGRNFAASTRVYTYVTLRLLEADQVSFWRMFCTSDLVLAATRQLDMFSLPSTPNEGDLCLLGLE